MTKQLAALLGTILSALLAGMCYDTGMMGMHGAFGFITIAIAVTTAIMFMEDKF